MDPVIATFQYLAAIISWLILKVFTNMKVIGGENLVDATQPLIVASNHESHLDPQLIAVALLKKPSLFPLRYMTKDEFFGYPIFNLLIWALGAFKAHKGKGIGKSLLAPTKILENGGSVIIFPEGKLIRLRPGIGKGRRGAALLALFTRAGILPVSVHTPHSMTPWEFLFKRRRVVVNIGVPFYLNNLDFPDYSDENSYRATEVIMKKIAHLYNQHQYDIPERRVSERRGSK